MKKIILTVSSLILWSATLSAQNTLTNGEIYDFEIGDEFRYTIDYFPAQPPAGYVDVVTNKLTFPDSIIYTFARNSYTSTVVNTPDFQLEYTYTQSIYNQTIKALNSVAVFHPDTSVLDSVNPLYWVPWSYALSPFDSGGLQGILFKDTSYFLQCNIPSYRWSAGDYLNASYEYSVAKGLGLIYSDIADIDGPASTSVTYTLQSFISNGMYCHPNGMLAPVSTEELSSAENTLIIYPNPTQNILNLQGLRATQNRILVYNSLGALVLNQTTAPNNTAVDVRALPSGMYLVHVLEDSGAISALKFVKD